MLGLPDKKSLIKYIPYAAVSFYIVSILLGDIVANKILWLPLLGAVAGGMIIYPITFTLRDLLHRLIGKRLTKATIWLAGVLSLFMAFIFYVVGLLPSAPFWKLQDAYASILMPTWRIVVASIVAEIVSELIDTEIFSFVIRKTKLSDEVGVILSNAISTVVDSFVFIYGAFLGVLPTVALFGLVKTQIYIKWFFTILSTPLVKISKLAGERKVDL